MCVWQWCMSGLLGENSRHDHPVRGEYRGVGVVVELCEGGVHGALGQQREDADDEAGDGQQYQHSGKLVRVRSGVGVERGAG